VDLIPILRVIGGYILVLFIPGFALTWAFYPRRGDLGRVERVALSFVFSILSVMLAVLATDIVGGFNVTPLGIVVTIAVVTAIGVLAWAARVAFDRSTLKAWIAGMLGARSEKAEKGGKDGGRERDL